MIGETLEEAQSVEAIGPDADGVTESIGYLENSVEHLNSSLSELTRELSPILYDRAMPRGSNVISEVHEEASAAVKNLHSIHGRVIHAINVVQALNKELNL